MKGKRILDIGCGFGDLNKFFGENDVDEYEYVGIDIVEELIIEAKLRNASNGKASIRYICGDFQETNFIDSFDYVLASGIFNRKFIEEQANYTFINRCIDKAFNICTEGIAFDFLSDKVDYRYQHTFHSSPEKNFRICVLKIKKCYIEK